ncbi:hypothetical protein B0H17DRAFT_1214131 [Mycena rosella]|uniref:RxLR effector protein n=1 Tax=Mycena rosella TaxID=1033263 RepID=A0AAD7CNQ8_MYCRO|nr:hypothetical protein B0H17DRAFT_1214131 [Mycena rosella]
MRSCAAILAIFSLAVFSSALPTPDTAMNMRRDFYSATVDGSAETGRRDFYADHDDVNAETR